MVTEKDIVRVNMDQSELDKAIEFVARCYGNVSDRPDLHERDLLEKFIDGLMGELAERMVLKWLKSQGKDAEPATDKAALLPDPGHDIYVVRASPSEQVKCSVKSSLSYVSSMEKIIRERRLATTPPEVKAINVQVFFWLKLRAKKTESRLTVPAIRESAIICWFGERDLPPEEFEKYKHENRLVPKKTLSYGRPMGTLLPKLR
jgi:hypothetical protein